MRALALPFVESSGPRRAGGVEEECVAAGQEGQVS